MPFVLAFSVLSVRVAFLALRSVPRASYQVILMLILELIHPRGSGPGMPCMGTLSARNATLAESTEKARTKGKDERQGTPTANDAQGTDLGARNATLTESATKKSKDGRQGATCNCERNSERTSRTLPGRCRPPKWGGALSPRGALRLSHRYLE